MMVVVPPGMPLGGLPAFFRVVAVALRVIDPVVVVVGKHRHGDGTEHYD
jgi:hypothetical protein